MGAEQWTKALVWDGQEGFNSQLYNNWGDQNKTYAEVKSYKNFTFAKIYDAGHMVAKDQPEVAYKMINQFIIA